jgi:UDP-N-acetylmuramoyl-tripeptide--D-alanyl-D-alanine ligase
MPDSQKPLMGFAELRAAVNAEVFGVWETGENRGFSSVCIDSREVQEGALFVCLAGTGQDGHQYAESAFQAGAGAVLAEREKVGAFDLARIAETYKKPVFAVDNTLRALQDAARAYLEKFPRLLRIGVTGSSGKTTVKEIAASILGRGKSVIMNKGNLNSETGLPLSVFETRAEHAIGVFEMGMNRSGEIGELSRVLKPHIALITNIGAAHIGVLGSKDAIAAEKKAVFSQFTGAETALIPASDPYKDFLAQGVKGKVVFYETECRAKDLGLEGTELEYKGEKIRFCLPGAHNVKNALAATALAEEAGADALAVKQGLEAVRPLFGRSEIIQAEGVTIVRDCYNANPESSESAVRFCDSVNWEGGRVYIIGSMLELGAESEAAHKTLGVLLAESKADRIGLFGAETKPIADFFKNAGSGKKCFFTENNRTALADALSIQTGDLVLLKGSRACALEKIADLIRERRISGK